MRDDMLITLGSSIDAQVYGGKAARLSDTNPHSITHGSRKFGRDPKILIH